jgi:hypothetical protein
MNLAGRKSQDTLIVHLAIYIHHIQELCTGAFLPCILLPSRGEVWWTGPAFWATSVQTPDGPEAGMTSTDQTLITKRLSPHLISFQDVHPLPDLEPA